MIRIAQAPNAAIATVWADLLREAGYPVSIQRLYLGSAAGELAPGDCLPEIWVHHDAHAAAARTLLDQLLALPQRRWTCPQCGEAIEGGFEQCWNCSALMPRP